MTNLNDWLDQAERRGIAEIKAGKAPKVKKPPFKGRKPTPKRKARKHVDPR